MHQYLTRSTWFERLVHLATCSQILLTYIFVRYFNMYMKQWKGMYIVSTLLHWSFDHVIISSNFIWYYAILWAIYLSALYYEFFYSLIITLEVNSFFIKDLFFLQNIYIFLWFSVSWNFICLITTFTVIAVKNSFYLSGNSELLICNIPKGFLMAIILVCLDLFTFGASKL